MSDELITAEVREAIARAINPAAFDPQPSNGVPDWIGWEVQRRAAYRYADAALSVIPAIIEKARKEERERAAKVARGLAGANSYKALVCDEIADAILARTQPETQEPTQ